MAKTEVQRFVAREKDGPLVAKRFHLFEDCSKLRDTPGIVMHPVTQEHIDLLGLRGCNACEKRETGGPTIEALEEFFDGIIVEGGDIWPSTTTAKAAAWELHEFLRTRDVYLAVRKPKDATEVIAEHGIK